MKNKRNGCTESGFSLIELMVSISVLAILLSVGVPSFTSMVQRYTAQATASDFHHMLQLARSEAAKSSQTVTLCPSSGRNSAATCQATSDWSIGWLLKSADNTVIHVARAPDSDVALSFSTAVNSIEFDPIGASTSNNVTFTSGSSSYVVCLLPSGKSFTAADTGEC